MNDPLHHRAMRETSNVKFSKISHTKGSTQWVYNSLTVPKKKEKEKTQVKLTYTMRGQDKVYPYRVKTAEGKCEQIFEVWVMLLSLSCIIFTQMCQDCESSLHFYVNYTAIYIHIFYK